MNYVLGFAFNSDLSQIILINKLRPSWQAGTLNGVGGKIEPGESPLEAMYREFEEETGIICDLWPWIPVCEMRGPHKHDPTNWLVIVFATILHNGTFAAARSTTDEKISKVTSVVTPCSLYQPNIPWLVALSRQMLTDRIDYDIKVEAQR